MRKWKNQIGKYRALPYAMIALALTACNGAQALLRAPASVPYAVTLLEGSLFVQDLGSFGVDAALHVDPTSYLTKSGDFAIHGAANQANQGEFTIKRESVDELRLQGKSHRTDRRESCSAERRDPSCAAEYGILKFDLKVSSTEISGYSPSYREELQWRLIRRTNVDGSESVHGAITVIGSTLVEDRANLVALTVSPNGAISGQVRYRGVAVAINALMPQPGTPDALEEDPERARGTAVALLILSALHMLN